VRVTGSLLVGLALGLSNAASAQQVEGGVFLTYAFLEQIGGNDHRAGTSTMGLGGRAVWHVLPFVDVEGEVAGHPNAGVQGYRIQGFAGAKAGFRFYHLGVFAKARPGFIYFSRDPFGVERPGRSFFEPAWADSLEPAIDLGGVLEYYAPNGVIIRFDLADTIVHYEPRSVFQSQHLPRRDVGGFTTRNRQWSFGVSKRF
jgi:hypothetical protein